MTCAKHGDACKGRVLRDNDLTIIADYVAEADAIVKRILNDQRLGIDNEDRRDVVVSTLNLIASKVIGHSAVKTLESVEEQKPELQSREQLSFAFSFVTSDVIHRLMGVFGIYADQGTLPDISVEMGQRAREEGEEKENATVH